MPPLTRAGRSLTTSTAFVSGRRRQRWAAGDQLLAKMKSRNRTGAPCVPRRPIPRQRTANGYANRMQIIADASSSSSSSWVVFCLFFFWLSLTNYFPRNRMIFESLNFILKVRDGNPFIDRCMQIVCKVPVRIAGPFCAIHSKQICLEMGRNLNGRTYGADRRVRVALKAQLELTLCLNPSFR